MKKAAILIFLLALTISAAAQDRIADSLKRLLRSSKPGTNRVDLLTTMGNYESRTSIDSTYPYNKRALVLAEKIGYEEGAKNAETGLAYFFITKGDYPRALEYLLDILKRSEKLKDVHATVDAQLRIGEFYYEQGDKQQMTEYCKKAYKTARQLQNDQFTFAAIDMGFDYVLVDRPDSALTYFLEGYQSAIKNKEDMLAYAYSGLAIANGLLVNYDIALPYYKKAITALTYRNDQRMLSFVYRNLSKMYKKMVNVDSALNYAQKASLSANISGNNKERLESYALLANTYLGADDHKAALYFGREASLRDSISSDERNKEVENLNFDERERQQQLREQELLDIEKRKENLQLSAIALFIPVFFLGVLLLSRTRVNRRLIDFMSVLSLLLVFEFITLLTHPWIERLTHNMPLLELIILVALASFLVPLHHNSAHWLKEKLALRHQPEPVTQKRRASRAKKPLTDN